MPRSFNLSFKKDARTAARAVVGFLLLANVVVALIAFHPWGGGPEELRLRQQELRRQAVGLEERIARSKALVAKVELARKEGDGFLAQYITGRRSTFSTILEELNTTAKQAGIRQKESSIVLEPVEGSDTLSQMTISVGYEGTYQNLTRFVNLLDKSKRFLIIENMVASPQQSGQMLNVSFKLDTFVREEPGSVS